MQLNERDAIKFVRSVIEDAHRLVVDGLAPSCCSSDLTARIREQALEHLSLADMWLRKLAKGEQLAPRISGRGLSDGQLVRLRNTLLQSGFTHSKKEFIFTPGMSQDDREELRDDLAHAETSEIADAIFDEFSRRFDASH